MGEGDMSVKESGEVVEAITNLRNDVHALAEEVRLLRLEVSRIIPGSSVATIHEEHAAIKAQGKSLAEHYRAKAAAAPRRRRKKND